MKHATLAAVGIAFFSLLGAASAADIPPAQPYRAPAMVPASFNWTGFYLGAYGGYAFGAGDVSGFDGWMAGGTIGYNYQPVGSAFVFGIEADGGWTNFGDSTTFIAPGVVFTASSEAKATATLRARFGAAFDRTLVYVTGGGAWLRNEISLGLAIAGVGAIGATDTRNHMGYAVGGGLEYAFTPNWSVKAEYLYLGLGSENYFSIVPSGDVNIHTVKLGLNYRFGG
jgi:outer membrane immunogenic protein